DDEGDERGQPRQSASFGANCARGAVVGPRIRMQVSWKKKLPAGASRLEESYYDDLSGGSVASVHGTEWMIRVANSHVPIRFFAPIKAPRPKLQPDTEISIPQRFAVNHSRFNLRASGWRRDQCHLSGLAFTLDS